MERFPGQPIDHLYSEWRKTTPVVCLGSEETGRRLDERIERFFGREISLVARHCRPIQRRTVDSVVPRHTAHSGKLSADIVLYPAQLLGVVAPRHYVAVAAYRGKSVTVCLVEIAVNPLLVNGV